MFCFKLKCISPVSYLEAVVIIPNDNINIKINTNKILPHLTRSRRVTLSVGQGMCIFQKPFQHFLVVFKTVHYEFRFQHLILIKKVSFDATFGIADRGRLTPMDNALLLTGEDFLIFHFFRPKRRIKLGQYFLFSILGYLCYVIQSTAYMKNNLQWNLCISKIEKSYKSKVSFDESLFWWILNLKKKTDARILNFT